MRGPAIRPADGPGQPSPPARPGPRERFDRTVLDVVTEVDARWQHRLGLVEYAVEEVPLVPEDWSPDQVPLSSLVRGSGSTPTRLVVFRRPLQQRCQDREELEALVLTVVVEQLADLLGIDAEEVDPRYRRD
ncbi:metallopeptidase family protein [Nocardioides sp. MJB4]|uniref:Metallopeptidase family protein n=1 Tax=Nocardioides donggukensis TaxID=2774019 RepID=A0A927K9J9_9ACTN|nr:metallopeptidase family protein [Nocardioides donggukensis]